METGFMNRIIGLVIALVVGGLLVGGLLIPTVQGMTETEKTQINEGANYALYESGDTHVITFTETTMITDGIAQPLPDTSVYGAATVVYGTGGIMRIDSSGTLRFWGYISGDAVADRSMGAATNVTLTISDDGSIASSGATIDRGFSGLIMYPNPVGNYALSYNPYILEDSIIYGAGATNVGGINYGVTWTGDIEGVEVTSIYPPDQEITGTVVNTTNPVTNLLKVSSVVISDATADADFTYTYFFAPKEISYLNPIQLDATQIALFGVISILGIVALVVVAANGIRNKY